MPWSIEHPPAPPVLGDPASVDALRASTHRSAYALGSAADALPEAQELHRRDRRRLRELEDRIRLISATLDSVSDRLADHGSALADARGLGARIVDRAGQAGLRVDGVQVQRPGGVRGVADAASEQGQADAEERLQRVLDAVLRDLEGARAALRSDLAAARDALGADRSPSR